MEGDVMNATLIEVLARHWGFPSFRPLQAEAMEAALGGRDTLVVMPTGGGKSLCYQAPAIVNGSLTVVVSPLISLMKDQVDGLVACGVAAAQLNRSPNANCDCFSYRPNVWRCRTSASSSAARE
jgi:ATP-dependent DNA helicase RecQ